MFGQELGISTEEPTESQATSCREQPPESVAQHGSDDECDDDAGDDGDDGWDEMKKAMDAFLGYPQPEPVACKQADVSEKAEMAALVKEIDAPDDGEELDEQDLARAMSSEASEKKPEASIVMIEDSPVTRGSGSGFRSRADMIAHLLELATQKKEKWESNPGAQSGPERASISGLCSLVGSRPLMLKCRGVPFASLAWVLMLAAAPKLFL